MDSIKPPKKIKNLFSKEDFNEIRNYFKFNQYLNTIGYDEFGRKLIGCHTDKILSEYSSKILPMVKEEFNNDLIMPTYSLFAEYGNSTISLYKHKDSNACTYTVDVVLYQTRPWGLWVEGQEYILQENEALLFFGEDQTHWRETINNNTDIIGVVFFHYANPDHWFFTKGPEHVEKIRESVRRTM